jgi:hypothetical protein
MKRRLRHILPPLSAIMVILVALFVALPHDICISKVVSADACECAPSASSNGPCCCCGDATSATSCGDKSATDSHDHEAPASGSSCFSISSDQAQMTGPERVHAPAVAYAVVAVLPLPIEVSAAQPKAVTVSADATPGRDEVHLHRDNCVFLI